MDLAQKGLTKLSQERRFFNLHGVKVKICGDLSFCSREIREAMQEVETLTEQNQTIMYIHLTLSKPERLFLVPLHQRAAALYRKGAAVTQPRTVDAIRVR
jgi:undecaprenyl pyrophosphate synthase